MKTLLTAILISVSFINLSFSQNYLPVLKDSISWNVVSSTLNFGQGGITRKTKAFTIDDYEFNFDNHIYRALSIDGNISHNYYFREDSFEQKIYAYSTADSMEFLVYDFSIDSIGDTFTPSVFFEGNFSSSWPTYTVTSINTIQTFGVKRKKIVLETDDWCLQMCPEQITWVEGIGSEYSFNYFDQYMNWSFLDGARHYVICAFRNGKKIYTINSTSDICWEESTSIEELANAINLKVFPNPVSDILKIEFNLTEGEILEIDITDILGRKVKTIANSNLIRKGFNKLKINTSDWPSGTYFIILKHSNGLLSKSIIRSN